jgi:hypothetical protein
LNDNIVRVDSLLLLLFLGSLHHDAFQGERHPQSVVLRISHFIDVADDRQLGKLGSTINQGLVRNIRCEVQIEKFQVVAVLKLNQEYYFG